jgi:hypothetical protein
MSEPIHILSLGAGVQSSTLALMAAAGEVTPMPTAAIFADTQDEPASVYKWLDWLEKQLPFPVYRVTSGKLSEGALRLRTSKKGKTYFYIKLPLFTLSKDGDKGMIGQRNCTEDYKIRPIRRELLRVAGISPRERNLRVIQWIGISLDEAHRMKTFRGPWAKNRWPLIEMNMHRRHCLDWMASHKFPTPPRSACVYCPFHSDRQWRELRDNSPAEFAEAVRFERALNQARGQQLSASYLHAKRIPLDQVDFSTDTERGQGMLAGFGNECEGMCGV